MVVSFGRGGEKLISTEKMTEKSESLTERKRLRCFVIGDFLSGIFDVSKKSEVQECPTAPHIYMYRVSARLSKVGLK